MAGDQQQGRWQDCGFGISCIDTELFRVGLAACYLLRHADEAVFIDTGTRNSIPLLLDVLRQQDIKPEQISWVMPTHVHLDHAGGAGALMQHLPNARLLIHERGARHMIAPDKLQAGSLAVYGQERYEKAFGSLLPVPEERVVVAPDGYTVDLGGRVLTFFDTPGHARHHYVVWDEYSRGLFTGDTFGVSYPELNSGTRRFMFPPTTPIQFDPDAWHDSVARLVALQPDRVFLTHYGMHEGIKDLASQLHEQIDVYVQLSADVLSHYDSAAAARLAQALMQHSLSELAERQCPQSPENIRRLLKGDMDLNAQGLLHWRQGLARAV
jgi:glyoxylase-like metal-dependent hydrolase (beta-lactamase superfamily II)